MKNKKTIIIVIGIVITYLVLAIVLFGWENFKNKFQYLYIMLDSGDKWQLKDGKWYDVEDEKDYNWKKFDIYIDNQLLGNYSLMYNNKWYIFNEKRESQKYDGNLIAIRGNKKYQVIDFEIEDLDQDGEEILKSILEEEHISYPKELTYAKQLTLDFDGDKDKETLYVVSNIFSEDESTKFSLIFIKDGKVKIISKDILLDTNQYDKCLPKIEAIIDIEKDLKYEIIIECNYFSLIGSCSNLYQQKKGTYRLVKGC